jgi:hypothetical protein
VLDAIVEVCSEAAVTLFLMALYGCKRRSDAPDRYES